MGLEFPSMGYLDIKGGHASFTFTEDFKTRITSQYPPGQGRPPCTKADFALSPPEPEVKNACRLHRIKFEINKD
jgi:hypothetical protein